MRSSQRIRKQWRLFKDYAANGPTAPVKAFAQKTLPTLEHHLMMVQDIRGKTPKS